MIYVPDLQNYKCYVVQSEGVIRGYEQIPTNNSSVSYRDFYINSSYIYRDGTQTFSQYTTLPVCLDKDILTTDYQYRIDYPDILIIFVTYLVVCVFLPIKIFMKLFKKGGL